MTDLNRKKKFNKLFKISKVTSEEVNQHKKPAGNNQKSSYVKTVAPPNFNLSNCTCNNHGWVINFAT